VFLWMSWLGSGIDPAAESGPLPLSNLIIRAGGVPSGEVYRQGTPRCRNRSYCCFMTERNRDEVREFLTTRRAKVRPDQVGLAPGAIRGGPALARNGRMDIIAANTLGRALHVDAHSSAERPVNLARHAFVDRRKAELFYPDWEATADAIVAILRTEAGRDPYDKDLQDLIDELSTRSEEFRTKWGDHNVCRHATGVEHFHHPIVGTLDLLFEASGLMADQGWNLLIYAAEPGAPTADALRLLASWAASHEQENAPAPTKSTTSHAVLNPARSD
jgi:hypothetical protein